MTGDVSNTIPLDVGTVIGFLSSTSASVLGVPFFAVVLIYGMMYDFHQSDEGRQARYTVHAMYRRLPFQTD